MGVEEPRTSNSYPSTTSQAAEGSTKRKRQPVNDHHLDEDKEYYKAKPETKVKRAKNHSPKKDKEKRLRRWRKEPPQSYIPIKQRAMTQRMTVLDRTRGGTDDVPEEAVEIAGTTGNVYTVTIDKSPNCTCPHAQKGNQCKHIIYVLINTLKAPEQLQYQLAFTSSELREIFSKAPPIPTGDNTGDGKRKSIEDDCPICCMEFNPDKENIVYCKAACGNNIHEACFKQWAAAKKSSGGVTCPFCRSPWMGDETKIKKIAKSGKVNHEGYVNVSSELGLSGRRDYSSYHSYWVDRQIRDGVVDEYDSMSYQ